MARVFSPEEVKGIVLAFAVLSVLFAASDILRAPRLAGEAIAISAFAVGIGFIGHELAHKFSARRFGFHAEFQVWNQGILLAIAMAIITRGGLIFAAPGAVVFGPRGFRRVRISQVGIIGIAGPVFNLAMAAILLPLAYFFPIILPNLGAELFAYAATVNAWLALFNLIPFDPLDGGKVFRWNKLLWGLAVLAALALLMLSFG